MVHIWNFSMELAGEQFFYRVLPRNSTFGKPSSASRHRWRSASRWCKQCVLVDALLQLAISEGSL